MNFVQAHRVIYVVNQTAIRPCCQDLIGLEPQWEPLYVEYLLNLTDELHSELLLSHIIIAFHNETEKAPRFKMPERACQADARLLLLTSFLD